MKITLIGLTYPFRGGISHFTTALHNTLAKHHDLQLISFSRLYPKLLFPGTTQFDVGENPFEAAPPADRLDTLHPVTWLRVYLTVRKYRPHQVIFIWWSPVLAPAYSVLARLCRRIPGVRIVFYCHNVFPHENGAVARTLTRLALGGAQVFLTNSESDRQTLQNLYPGKTAVKTFHPLYDIFPKTGMTREAAQKKLGLLTDQPVLLFFGHVRAYKGLEVLLQALPRVIARHPCQLVVAGEFYQPGEIFETLIREGNIGPNVHLHNRYIGNEEVETFFMACDAVVLPYRSASQSGVVPLAYHYDRPVVTTHVGGLPEVVAEGQTGYLAPPNDPTAFAESIIRLLEEKDRVPFADHIRRFKQKISWDALAETIAGLKPAEESPEP